MITGPLSPEEIESFDRNGYIIVRGLLDAEETAMLLEAAKSDSGIMDHSYGRSDAAGRLSKLALWNHPGDDIYGAIARSRRVVDAMEQLLGGEVYHYHSKMMLKEPKVGGAWEWHQDYGYWYNNGCLFPDMASCLIAVDRAVKANGCLQVLKGSHKMGRIEHGKSGDQAGADPERVEAAKQRFELVYCELEPGDAIIFHSNLLHASGPNESEMSRWSLICCYNAAANDPYKESRHPRYTPLNKLPDSAVKEAGIRRAAASQSFMNPAR